MPKRWTKKAAIERMRQNALLHEALRVEPRLQPIINEALKQRNVPGYNRIHTYNALKARFELLVGWHCSKPKIKTREHYDTVVRTVDDLLPPDNVDLHPDG